MNDHPDLAVAVARLAGLPLSRVVFGPGWVTLEFAGEYNAFLQVNTPIELKTPSTELVVFDPSRHSVQPAASALVALRDASVKVAEVSSEQFSLTLVEGYELRVMLDPTDFEPILFSGSHHMSPGQLSWHFVVTAGCAP